jgi:hypothetical protein
MDGGRLIMRQLTKVLNTVGELSMFQVQIPEHFIE